MRGGGVAVTLVSMGRFWGDVDAEARRQRYRDVLEGKRHGRGVGQRETGRDEGGREMGLGRVTRRERQSGSRPVLWTML